MKAVQLVVSALLAEHHHCTDNQIDPGVAE
jgi:hypothetical protein